MSPAKPFVGKLDVTRRSSRRKLSLVTFDSVSLFQVAKQRISLCGFNSLLDHVKFAFWE